jgi:AraC-like DNA-binding protein
MEIKNFEKHNITCVPCSHTKKPLISLLHYDKNSSGEITLDANTIFFIYRGAIEFQFEDGNINNIIQKKMIFLPKGSQYLYSVVEKSTIITFKINHIVSLCDNCTFHFIDQYVKKSTDIADNLNNIGISDIKKRIDYFIRGIVSCLLDGINCNSWYETKIKEFFLMLKMYYTTEEIYFFLFKVISDDIIMLEHFNQNSINYQSVKQIADSFYMSPKAFSARFTKIFGTTPMRWLIEQKSKKTLQEITSTKKSFKQIAFELEFLSESQFTNFCKKEIGKNPSQIRMCSSL